MADALRPARSSRTGRSAGRPTASTTPATTTPAPSGTPSPCSPTPPATCTSATGTPWPPPTPTPAYKRMQGYNVLFPMGFDAFGLPAENAAIKQRHPPLKWTMDEHREHAPPAQDAWAPCSTGAARSSPACPSTTSGPSGSSCKLYEHGLAYRAKAAGQLVPQLPDRAGQRAGGATADCERCGTAVTKRDLEQWFFRITNYADELLDHFEHATGPSASRPCRRNWIGRSEGAEIAFGLDVPGVDEKEIRVFTTRPDTIYGVTFMVLAPEHPLVDEADHARPHAPRSRPTSTARPPPDRDRAPLHREGEDRRLHRRLLPPTPQRRARPHLDRRLRPAELRHRRRHGRARPRPARLRVRQEVRPAHPGRHRPARTGTASALTEAYVGRRHDGQLRPLRRHAQRPRAYDGRRRLRRGARAAASARSPTTCATG